MQDIILGTDNVSVTIRIVDSTAFTPEEGVTSATAGLALWYRKGQTGTVTALTESNLAGPDSAHSDGGMIHLDDGYYRVDLPDAAIPTSENEVTVVGGTATGMIVLGTALIGVTGTAGTVDAVWDEVLTGATHNVATSAGRRLRAIQEFQGYEGGAVWIDTVNGTAGTTSYENGTVENPVDSIADATTIATALSLTTFHIIAGSTITLAQAYDGYAFIGDNWTLALGGRDISNCVIEGAASVTGVSAGASGGVVFRDCEFGAATAPAGLYIECGFGLSSGTLTAANAGQYLLRSCYSRVPGSGTPSFNWSGKGATVGVNGRQWHGGSSHTIDGDVTVSWEVNGGGGQTFAGGGTTELRGIFRQATFTGHAAGKTSQIIGLCGPIAINGTGGTVNIYGVVGTVTDNSSAAVTINDYTATESLTAATIADAVWDEVASGHTTAGTFGEYIPDIPEDVWSYSTRTLTQAAASVSAAVTGDQIVVYRGTRWEITLTGLTDFTGYSKIYFTAKKHANDADTASIVHIQESTEGTGDGLVYWNGAAASDATDASITVNSTTSITVYVEVDVTDEAVPTESLVYGVKFVDSDGHAHLASIGGLMAIRADIPKAVT